MVMTELEMMNELEMARIMSKKTHSLPIYALSNGHNIVWFREHRYVKLKKCLESKGYWICSIFVDGNRVEA